MRSNTMAAELAENADHHVDADTDWLRIDANVRRRFCLQYLRDHELELDFFADERGIAALNSMLDLIVYGHASAGGSKMILALLADYQPAKDLYEDEREKWLLDNSFVGQMQ